MIYNQNLARNSHFFTSVSVWPIFMSLVSAACFYISVGRPNLAFCTLLDSIFFVSINAENPELRSEALRLLTAEYAAIVASMNTPEARKAAKDAFDAEPEVFRRPLKPRDEGHHGTKA